VLLKIQVVLDVCGRAVSSVSKDRSVFGVRAKEYKKASSRTSS
jgi:hypothetical protein